MSAIDDTKRGLYGKYHVERLDSDPHGKHGRCRFYVLDMSHDPFAIPALRTYADACQKEYPKLAEDLRRMADDAERRAGETSV